MKCPLCDSDEVVWKGNQNHLKEWARGYKGAYKAYNSSNIHPAFALLSLAHGVFNHVKSASYECEWCGHKFYNFMN